MAVNWLPFVVREFLRIPPGERKQTTLGAFSVASSQVKRVFMQDSQIYAAGDRGFDLAFPDPGPGGGDPNVPPGGPRKGMDYLWMRHGWNGKGYLTEELHPYGVFFNCGRPQVPVWRFIRPYRIDPGQKLSVKMFRGRVADKSVVTGFLSCSFFGKRLSDDKQIMLYAVQQIPPPKSSSFTDLRQAPLDAQSTLTCPSDSSVELYGMCFTPFSDLVGTQRLPPVLQVTGHEGRDWFAAKLPPTGGLGPVPPGVDGLYWANLPFGYMVPPPGSLIKLGEERGWLRDPGEQYLVEIENRYPDDDMLVAVTLRGSMEVVDG